MGLCPFHREKTPSFNVNPGRQIFHCFGCQTGGDVFKFVQLYENLNFGESVRRLAERAKVPIEASTDGEAGARGDREALLQLHEAVCQRWQKCLETEAAGAAAREYLSRRGLPADSVRLFRLGAAPAAWDDTVNYSKSRGFDPSQTERAGLIIARDQGGHYDRFRGRLMFPICDEQGRVVAFSGRILDDAEKAPKYVNSPETPIFIKGRVLYALDKARRAILDEGRAIVCEGQIDTIICHHAGLKHAVAPQGTALTADQARILRRYAAEVVLCFDGDAAGGRAAVKVLDDLLASGLSIRVAGIPEPEDPDSFVRKFGAEAFRDLVGKAEGFFDFYLRRLCEENDPQSDRGRVAITTAYGEAARKTGNAVQIDACAQKLALRLGVAIDAVRAEFRKLAGGKRAGPNPAEVRALNRPAVTVDEAQLLKLLLLHQELIPFAATYLDPDWIQSESVRTAVAKRIAQPGDVARLLDALGDDQAARALVTEAAAESQTLDQPDRQLADVILGLRNGATDREIEALTMRLRQPGLDAVQMVRIVRLQQSLREERKRPLSPYGTGAPSP